MSKIYRVTGESVYARTGPQSWCIGNLFHNDEFQVEGRSGDYVWGRASGNGFQGHCWINKKSLRPYPHTKHIIRDHRFEIEDIADSYTERHGKLESGETHPHLTVHVRVTAKLATFYGNYWHDFPYDFPYSVPFGQRLYNPLPRPLHRGYPLGWRYTIKGGLAAMVLDYKHNPPRWGFIYRAHIETPQQDRYFNAFATNPENRGKRNPYNREPEIIYPKRA